MKLVPSPTRPHLFSNPTGPERKRHWRVHSLQPRIGPEKSQVLTTDLAAAPLLSFSLFTYLLAYYFIFLPAWWIHVISEFGFQL